MPKITSKNIVQGQTSKPQKRKKKSKPEPAAKRSKQELEESEEEENRSRFKYVLAPKFHKQDTESSDDEDEPVQDTSQSKRRKVPKKKEENLKNGSSKKKLTGKENKVKNGSSKKKVAEYQYSSDESDDSYMFDDMESLSEEEEESCEEEWSTDTDYTPRSFHSSECDSVSSNEEELMSEDYDSSDDEDYQPPIEDKYIKKGDAIMYDAKGLDLAFGNSSESQIIDLSDVHAAVIDSDEEAPKLLPMDGQQSEEIPAKTVKSTEDTFKNLSINDEDEAVESSHLLQRATFYNCAENRGVIVKINRTIHFHGIIVIKPLVNSVQVNGFTLDTNQSLKATSISRTDYFLNLTPVICENCDVDRNELREELKGLLEIKTDADEIVDNLNVEKDALLHLQLGLPDKSVEMLQTYLSDPVLPHKNMILKKSVCPSSELILATKFFVDEDNPRLNAYKINADWNHIELSQNTKIMIIGGKNVGKSAMSQYLINRNLNKYKKILLIDFDIGQPICGISQTVSATLVTKPLIGPGYLNETKVEKSFLFGDKSVMVSPFKYIECVSELMEYCNQNEEYKDIPWIINTMGYQKGFGLQLMCLLLKIIQPTDVAQVQHSNTRYNFKHVLVEALVNSFKFTFFSESYLQKFPQHVHFTTHVLDSIVNNSNNNNRLDDDEGGNGQMWTSNATEKRKISMLAQLSRLMRGGQTHLNDVIPFGTSIENVRLIVLDEDYETTQHASSDNGVNLDLFNGNLVYLCHSSENNNDEMLECFGVGVVRAIDKNHNYIYILLPQQENTSKLQSMVNVLAIGNVPLPSEILLKQNFGVNGNVPFVTFFKDRSKGHKKYVNKRNIKDCF